MRDRGYFPLPCGDDQFDKVIFLDIDGVLNDDHHTPGEPVIDEKMVSCLSLIVCQTNAHIVLSSSWKNAWRRFEESGFVPQSKYDSDLVELWKALRRYDLVIEDVTPDSDSGPDARPHEIRAWLLNHKNVRSFVILDDDDFWTFGWMDSHFVCTQTETDEIRWPGYAVTRRGLTMGHAKAAIDILNDCPPLSRQDTSKSAEDSYLTRVREQRQAAKERGESQRQEPPESPDESDPVA